MRKSPTTPGALAYAAYWQTHYALRHPTHSQALVGWTHLTPKTQQCWEAAAAAVLAWRGPAVDPLDPFVAREFGIWDVFDDGEDDPPQEAPR